MAPTSLAERIRQDLDDSSFDGALAEAIRQWLAADKAFNTWFLESTKGKLDDDGLFALLTGYQEDQDAIARAWRKFRDDRNPDALKASIALSLARLETLQSV